MISHKFFSRLLSILPVLAPVLGGFLLTVILIGPVQARTPAAVLDPPLSPGNGPGLRLLTSTATITTSPEILHLYTATNRPPKSEPAVIQSVNRSAQALNCNPSSGSGGLGSGTYDTTIAGQPATIIVGQGYDPAQPTYLAFYLHGDEGGYNFHSSSFDLINQFVNDNSWIYVAPQAPKAGDGDYYPWDGRGGGDIEGNATLVKDVLEDMFANYNVCRNVLFGASVSGGSWFYDIYFYPKNGGQYPAFMNLVCGSGGVSAAQNFFGSYDDLVALSSNADVKARTELKYTIGTGDFMYNNALDSVDSYTGLGFSVIPDYLPGVSHCLTGDSLTSSRRIRDYWQAKLGVLGSFSFDKALATTGIISPSTEVTYTLTAFNQSALATSNLVVGDSFSSGLAYVAGSAVANPAIIDLTNFPTATLPFTMSANSSVVITYRLQVSAVVTADDRLTNTAAISAPTFSEVLTEAVTIVVGSETTYIYLPLLIRN